MNSAVFIATLLFVASSANSLSCDQTIVDKILSSKDCPSDPLDKLHAISPFTTAVLHTTEVMPTIECVKVSVHAPEGKKTNSNFTIYFVNNVLPATRVSYIQEEVKCGQVSDTYDEGEHFNSYYLNIDKVGCYYRCPAESTEGVATAGCVVPMGKQSDPEVMAQVQSCKEKLAAVGFTGPLSDVEPCAA